MEVSVVIATFGDPKWSQLAAARALPSVDPDIPTLLVHAETLHEARNHGMRMVDTEWICFLDADDELEPGYFDAMSAGSADLRAPAVRYVSNGSVAHPRILRVAGHTHPCDAECLTYGNFMVIGTVAPTVMVRSLGGFRDFPWSEDWDLWVRCWKAGATIESIPQAVYRAHVRPDSRNRAPKGHERLAAHQAIAQANGLPVP